MGGLYINHFGAVRMRVNGTGNLDLSLISLDTSIQSDLASIPMSATTGKYPTVLANFNQQKAQLYGRVNAINESFQIDEIIIYVKPVAASYPI